MQNTRTDPGCRFLPSRHAPSASALQTAHAIDVARASDMRTAPPSTCASFASRAQQNVSVGNVSEFESFVPSPSTPPAPPPAVPPPPPMQPGSRVVEVLLTTIMGNGSYTCEPSAVQQAFLSCYPSQSFHRVTVTCANNTVYPGGTVDVQQAVVGTFIDPDSPTTISVVRLAQSKREFKDCLRSRLMRDDVDIVGSEESFEIVPGPSPPPPSAPPVTPPRVV